MARTNTPTRGFTGTGWQFPVRVNAQGGLSYSSGEQNIAESIWIILSTSKGERIMRPDFGSGLSDLAFAVNNSTTQAMAAFEVREALQNWEPRIEVLGVEVSSAGDRGEQLMILINYKVRTTDNRFNLVYPFYLERAGA